MRAVLALAILEAGLAGISPAQLGLTPANGSDGSDGPFAPTANSVLDTSLQPVFRFTSLLIPAGVTVSATGPNPLLILVQGSAQIDGVLDLSGIAGGVGANNAPGGGGGAGGPGGGAGGRGGSPASDRLLGSGLAGSGPSPGQPGVDGGLPAGLYSDPVGGGGGGGNGSGGAAGGPPNSAVPPSMSGAGGFPVFPCRAGSGGGGGGGDIDSLVTPANNDGGGGGGGGGGLLRLLADGPVVIGPSGAIRARGGAGGDSGGNGGAGGGGSGGSIEIVAPSIVLDGGLDAVGAPGGLATQAICGCSPGGAGGDGCILLAADALSGGGSAAPAPTVDPWYAIVTADLPAGRLAVASPGPGDVWTAFASFTLSPAPIPTPYGPFVLDFGDVLLGALFPVNLLPSVFVTLGGMGSGSIVVDLAPVGLPPGHDFIIWFQAFSTWGGGLSGISPPARLRVRS